LATPDPSLDNNLLGKLKSFWPSFWFHFGLPGVHIRYVLIRDVAGKFDRKPCCQLTVPFA